MAQANAVRRADPPSMHVETNLDWFGGLKRHDDRTIAANLTIENVLVSGSWKNYKDLFPCYTGTTVIYENRDTPFGNIVTSNKIMFRVPNEYIGLVNAAIVLQHPDFELKRHPVAKNATEFTLDGQVREIVYGFPRSTGWSARVSATGIPMGNRVHGPKGNARHLWRKEGPYIGPVVRNTGYWKSIHIDKRPTNQLSMAFIACSEQYKRRPIYQIGRMLR